MRKFATAGLAAVLAAVTGCGDGGSASPAAVKTTVVEDAAGGYKVAVPEGWVREVLPLTDPHRRWFAGRWKPANVALPVEALLVHLLAPGCPAANLASRLANAPIASEPEPKDYAVVSSGAGVVLGRQSFRIEVKYKSARYGELFEATAYVETSEGSGLLVTSRGSVKSEAVVKARLEAALAGLAPMQRVVREGAARPHAGGIDIGFPEGFDEYYGPSAFGTTAYGIGASDFQGRQETVSLLVGPPILSGEQFLTSLLMGATKSMKPAAPRKAIVAGQEVRLLSFSPAESAPRYEIACASFKLGSQPAALLVHAAAIPTGRAIEVFEKTAATLRFTEPASVSLRPVSFGEGGGRASLAPEGWTTATEGAVLASYTEELVPSPDGGEPKKRQALVLEATLEDDFRRDGSPLGAARDQAAALIAKKAHCIATEEFDLPDGRKAARLVAATPISYEVFLYARATPGTIAQVHLSALPALAAEGHRAATLMLAATRFAPFASVRTPDAAVLERSRKEIPALLDRGRGRAGGEFWYVEEVSGVEVGGQHVKVLAGGKWSDGERRPSKEITIASVMEGTPDAYMERVNLRATEKGQDGKSKVIEVKTESRIDGTDPKWISMSRQGEGEVVRQEKVERPDAWMPPDLSASDGLVVALAGSPEGTYAFATVHERFLSLTWREYRVKGEEEVEVPAGKFKARRVEAGAKSVYWVAEGKIVRAELGTFVRKLASREAALRYLKE
ncbi:MAG: hypothetical protein AAB074_09445 [Planctomycetota bacterium]